MTQASFKIERHPDLPPPITSVGVLGWLRANLFDSWHNSLLTALTFLFILWTLPGLIDWAFISAVWVGSNRDVCIANPDGACWAFVASRFGQFLYGFYPDAERWRVNLGFITLIVAATPLFFDRTPGKKWFVLFLLLFYPVISYALFYGGLFGLKVVETSLWGGLMVTLVISLVGIVASLPLGIILALGRRSSMPIVRAVCIVFIEFWRGVPLITVLFMASNMLPLFIPEGISLDKLLRALIGVMLFSSAYMAEVVRGGLQGLGKGQYEAADALGLTYPQKMRLIILPQALKMVIPGIVNTFIGLFKDTTLVSIIGLYDLLGIVQAGINDANWLAKSVPNTGYVFAGFGFWIFCFGMSRYSQALERKLHTGHKR